MPKSGTEWFARIASIANSQTSSNRYTPDDVKIVLKAWRTDYQAKQAKSKAELKIAKYEAKLNELRKVAATK